MGVENLAGTLYLDSNTNRQAKVHKKQQLITPSLSLIRVHRLGSLCAKCAHFLPSPPAPLPQRGRGEPRSTCLEC